MTEYVAMRELARLKSALVLAAAIVAFSASSPAQAQAAYCGLLNAGDLRATVPWNEFLWEANCFASNRRSGQWALDCRFPDDEELCTDGPWNAVETIGYKVPKSKAGRRYIRRLRNRANRQVLGRPALVRGSGSNPSSGSTIVHAGGRNIVFVAIYSQGPPMKAESRELAVDALRRYERL